MSSTARLGAFVLVAMVAFGMMIFWIGDRQFRFTRTYHLSAPFDNVAGLDEGASVRAGGVHVGTVQRIQLPHQPGDKVIVEMELKNSTRDVVKRDSIASIETEGLLGSKYVAVSFGSLEGEQVHDGDVIDSRPPVDYADVARKTSEMLDSAKEAIDSSKVAIGNINDASDDLKSITGKIDNGQGTLGAMVNDRSVYSNLNATVSQAMAGVTSFSENMEALKHNFFLKGFFKKRGYFDSSELTRNAIAKLPDRTPSQKFTFEGKDLFDKPDTAKLRQEKMLNQVGTVLESNPFGLAVVVAYSGMQGTKEENQTLSQARAMTVRQYLAQKFRVDDSRIKTMGLGEGGEKTVDKRGYVTVLIYPGARDQRLIEAKTKK
ncbi:MAG TPA: MlaD family protein [Blastocatellia bacterium]|nr:MlaD family protein [Blastocatellia bacterium]